MRGIRRICWGSRSAAALALGLFAAVAGAVQDEATFAALRADLEHRRANELAQPDGKSAKKQRKAVDKSLKLLDKSSTRLSSDVKIGAKCAGFLAKPFGDEFAAAPKLADLRDTFATLAADLTAIVESGVADVNGRADALPEKVARKIRKQTAKADKNLRSAASRGTDYKKRLAKLAAAAKALESAQKAADKGVLGAKAKPEQVVLTIDGESWASRDGGVLIQFFSGDDGLAIQGERDRQDGGEDELKIFVSGVPGEGRYALSDLPNVQVTYTEKPSGGPTVVFNLSGAGGVLVVDEYDTSAGRFRTRFAFDVSNAAAGTRVVTNGASDMSGRNVLGSGGSLFR